MQQKLLNMMGGSGKFEMVKDTHLSFKPFMDFVSERLKDHTSIKREILRFVHDKFAAYPELEQQMELEDVARYKEILDLLHVVLSSVVDDEKTVHWGLAVPMSPYVFYGSDSFYELLNEANSQSEQCNFSNSMEFAEFREQKLQHFYSFVLKRFYNIEFRSESTLVRNITDPRTGLVRHFRVNVDTRFVEATTSEQLPEINLELLRSRLISTNALKTLQELLPPSMFTFSGFNIITIADATTESALADIRDKVVNSMQLPEDKVFPAVIQSLKELVLREDIGFNIIPFLKVNGKLVNEMNDFCQSVLFADESGVAQALCMPMLEKFIDDPKVYYFGDLQKDVPEEPELRELFNRAGVMGYAMVPVFYNKRLVGSLEIFSKTAGALDEKVFSKLEPAIVLLAQLMQNSISGFDEQIQSVIKEKFTTLQPAVQWKFNEVAWNFLQQQGVRGASSEPGDIQFSNVNPLYGAIDIRNSTVERNAALAADLRIQFEVLSDVLQKLKLVTGFGLLDEKIYSTRQWLNRINADNTFRDEIRLNEFLDVEIGPFLLEFTAGNAALRTIADEYFEAVNEEQGKAQANRRELEKSMSTVIKAVNNYLDLFRDDLQEAYPVYFDKFRTDGVEYDIYIGQSITPDRIYSPIYLKNLRLMQLSSMAAIAKYAHSLIPLLSRPVETTQLIFIHSHPIDIRFRRDEKRFDVEGAYNIRYHIIKKRIDKVHIRGSKERLTQPGKIALVYFNQKEADEYVNYIHYLQGEGILQDDLEQLDLEELQGVSGLKALRVSVVLEDPMHQATRSPMCM